MVFVYLELSWLEKIKFRTATAAYVVSFVDAYLKDAFTR